MATGWRNWAAAGAKRAAAEKMMCCKRIVDLKSMETILLKSDLPSDACCLMLDDLHGAGDVAPK